MGNHSIQRVQTKNTSQLSNPSSRRYDEARNYRNSKNHIVQDLIQSSSKGASSNIKSIVDKIETKKKQTKTQTPHLLKKESKVFDAAYPYNFTMSNPKNSSKHKENLRFSQRIVIVEKNQTKQQILNRLQHIQYLKILQLTEEQSKNFDKLRKAFRQKIIKHSQQKNELDANISIKRQNRVKVLLAFYHLSNKLFKTIYDPQSAQFLDNIFKGKTCKVKQMIDKNPQLLLFRTKGNNYPLLYIAAMTGHTDLVEMIIKTGRSLNFQKDRSTPFHAAAWYNHYHVAKLLLNYGIPHYIKNIHDQTPLQNAEGQVYDLLKQAGKDKFTQLSYSIINKKLCKTIINVKHKGETIIRKIILKSYDKDFIEYVDAYHGTRLQNMQSIAMNGLKKPGSKIGDKLIQVQKGNILQGEQYNGDKNWAGKIYVSPSIHYAAQYSEFEYFFDEKLGRETGWKSVVQVKVKKGCYKQFGDTTGGYERVNNEPESLQYQIEDERNVEVVALMLVKRNWLGNFLQERNSEYKVTSVIILQSNQEQVIRRFSKSLILTAPQD